MTVHRPRVLALIGAATLLLGLPGAQPARAGGETFQVNSTVDAVDASPGDGECLTSAGACTLRAAIQEANAFLGLDTIRVPSGVYRLTLAGTEDAAASGDLDITEAVSIDGVGPSKSVVDGNGIDRVFEVLASASGVTLRGLTIRNGRPPTGDGGGLLNGGSTTLEDVTFSRNSAPGFGGGVAVPATASSNFVDGVNFFENRAGTYGGAIAAGTGVGPITPLRVGKARVSDGTPEGVQPARRRRPFGLRFEDNSAALGGGGLFVGSDGTVIFGGQTTFKDNLADQDGGGVFSFGTAILFNSTFIGNRAVRDGGGVRIAGDTAVLINLTLSDDGGRFRRPNPNRAGGKGGAIATSDATTVLVNLTITGNRAASGGGLAQGGSGGLAVVNTILSDNGPQNCSSALTATSFSIDSGTSCGLAGTGDLSNTAPRLGPLADNGGFLRTHALLPGSPAIDAGDNGNCGFDDDDARGFPRPRDGDGNASAICDIGAFEVQP